MSIEIDIVKKVSGFTLAVRFSAGNERLGILGASGCGKSMTLRCIAGITTPDEGFIRIGDRVVFDSRKHINIPPGKRRTGYLFQHYALFPTMTVRQNMEIVLQRTAKNERTDAVNQMLHKLRLYDCRNRNASQLSGGEQQRTAIGRMLLSSPEIILLDEPLSALDSFLQTAVEAELMNILTDFQMTKQGTVLFVSHSRDEIYRICQRMLVLQEGRATAFGTTGELFHHPGTVAAARLTGVKNIAPIQIVEHRKVFVPLWGAEVVTAEETAADMTHIGIRAHHLREALPDETVNCFRCIAARKQSAPFRIQEYLTILQDNTKEEHQPLIRLLSGTYDPLSSNEECLEVKRICLPPEHLMLLKN